ncbi:hypothetical protein CSIRO_0087 [Bradyrhizobiaceae bacterium SG-6C]|nr:hypothetical protein CSIRO_0087 [Bradyrhizobiaceae bacterium SG-6C]
MKATKAGQSTLQIARTILEDFDNLLAIARSGRTGAGMNDSSYDTGGTALHGSGMNEGDKSK